MPAHDLPYVEPAGGQNAEASSVVKAFGLARSRETAWPVPCRYGQGTARQVVTRHPGAPARCPAAGPGAARVRRWWQVARLPRAPGRRTWASSGRPSPALSPPWPGRAVAPAPAARYAGTGQGPAAIWREWPVRAWAVRLGLMSDRAVTGAGLSGTRFPRLPKGPGI